MLRTDRTLRELMERVRGRDSSSRDLAIAQKVLNHDVKLVEETLVELVDDNDVHGLGTPAAGSPCTTALHKLTAGQGNAGTPKEPQNGSWRQLRVGQLQQYSSIPRRV